MIMHMSLTNQHMLRHSGTVEWPGNPIHGSIIYREVVTPKSKSGNFGKATVCFFLEGKNTPDFETAEKLFDHYKVPEPEIKEEPKLLVRLKAKK